jgi:hypothetical protein
MVVNFILPFLQLQMVKRGKRQRVPNGAQLSGLGVCWGGSTDPSAPSGGGDPLRHAPLVTADYGHSPVGQVTLISLGDCQLLTCSCSFCVHCRWVAGRGALRVFMLSFRRLLGAEATLSPRLAGLLLPYFSGTVADRFDNFL